VVEVQFAFDGKVLVCRMDDGEDFYPTLRSALEGAGLRFAVILGAVGMLREVQIGWFDGKTYHTRDLEEPMEILSISGNLALKEDGSPFVHAHVCLGDEECNAFGGHLFKARVFNVCEISLLKLDGIRLTRRGPEGGPLKLYPEMV